MDSPYLLFELGGYNCKIGYSGELEPKKYYSSLVGTEKGKGISISDEKEKIYFGDNIWNNYWDLDVISMFKNGIIQNWEQVDSFFTHIFSELKISEGSQGIFLLEDPKTPKIQREKLTEILFEKHSFPSVFFNNSAVLALYGACKFDGFIVDVGYDASRIIPLQNGYIFESAVKLMNVGGRQISQKLIDLILNNNDKKDYKIKLEVNDFNPKIISSIKEKICYLNNNTKNNTDNTNDKKIDKKYTLPDGREINFEDEGFKAADVLYHPESIYENVGGLGHLIIKSYKDIKFLKTEDFENNIVLCGGSTLINGFEDRLKYELSTIQGGRYKDLFNVICLSERNYISWIGASIFSLMNIFKGLCTTKKEYDEYGVSVIHNKCFY